MTCNRRTAVGLRTVITLASIIATMYLKPAGVHASAVSGSEGASSGQIESAQPASGLTPPQNPFYLRAGMSLNLSSNSRFGDADCLSTSPAALYGCGKGNNGTSLGTQGNFGSAAGIEVGLGFLVAPKLRLETSIAYRPRFTFEGSANFVQTSADQPVTADLWSMSGMVATYMDLSKYGPFRLFVGTGAGLHYVGTLISP